MKVTCESCKKVLNVPDDKLPPGREVTVKCPSCGEPVKLRREEGGPMLPDLGEIPDTTPPSFAPLDETRNVPIPPPPPPGPEDGADPSTFMRAMESEMDILEEGSKRALVCDGRHRERVVPVLRKLGYVVSPVDTAADALGKLRFNRYDLIALDDLFDAAAPEGNKVHAFMDEQTMDVRRGTFVVLVTERFKSLDNMGALSQSVNMVMNPGDFSNFELMLRKSLREHDTFYAVFNQMLKETGREL